MADTTIGCKVTKVEIQEALKGEDGPQVKVRVHLELPDFWKSPEAESIDSGRLGPLRYDKAKEGEGKRTTRTSFVRDFDAMEYVLSRFEPQASILVDEPSHRVIFMADVSNAPKRIDTMDDVRLVWSVQTTIGLDKLAVLAQLVGANKVRLVTNAVDKPQADLFDAPKDAAKPPTIRRQERAIEEAAGVPEGSIEIESGPITILDYARSQGAR